MDRFADRQSLADALFERRRAGLKIALVPTMGNLHAGHLELVKQAKQHADYVVATIFVNPLQFGPDEDLDAYPRSLDNDCHLLTTVQCDAVFHPPVSEVYGDTPLSEQTIVHVPGVSSGYCGDSRPGHFDGVATVVCKLFNLVLPDLAVFGLKDYQQFLVIQKMVQDLCMPITLHGVEIVREESGLAMSSRNGYLTETQKTQATILHKILQHTLQQIQDGQRNYAALEKSASEQIREHGLRPDYFAICAADTLKPASSDDHSLVLLTAAYLGNSRLIDNLRFHL